MRSPVTGDRQEKGNVSPTEQTVRLGKVRQDRRDRVKRDKQSDGTDSQSDGTVRQSVRRDRQQDGTGSQRGQSDGTVSKTDSQTGETVRQDRNFQVVQSTYLFPSFLIPLYKEEL